MLESGKIQERGYKSKMLRQRPVRVISKQRVRKISGSFGWIDHRFINQGYIRRLGSTEILLYLFLVSVSNRHGLSFYGDNGACELLKIDKESLVYARDKLILESLIEYEDGVYQVLELPGSIFAGKGHSSKAGMFMVRDILKAALGEQEGGVK